MFTKLVVLLAILFAVWMGFKYIGRLQRVEKGQRKSVERTFSERMKRATRGAQIGGLTPVLLKIRKNAASVGPLYPLMPRKIAIRPIAPIRPSFPFDRNLYAVLNARRYQSCYRPTINNSYLNINPPHYRPIT